MIDARLLFLAGAAGLAAAFNRRRVADAVDVAGDAAGDWWNERNMSNADALRNSNVRAMLLLIRQGEGTSDENGYRRLVGGKLFAGYLDHPRQIIYIERLRAHSTAAGAYQILSRTWDGLRTQISLPDFSPPNQDLAAVQLIRGRNALADVMNGRLDAALAKISHEWASLPPFRYSRQGTLTLAAARQIYAAAGGIDATYA